VRALVLLTQLLISLASFSQNLSGVWEGKGNMTDHAKICIIRWNNTYIGYTYDEGMGFCKANFVGEFDSSKRKLKGVNKGFIEKTFLHFQSKYNLTYEANSSGEFLKGVATAKTVGAKILSISMPVFVTYKRISDKTDTTEFMRKWLSDKPFITNEDMVIDEELLTDSVTISLPLEESLTLQKNTRKNDTVSVIITHEKVLKLYILDNGIADKDTISIFHNNKLLLSKEEITVKGVTFTIAVSHNEPEHEIVLVAHNVGSIPPNTALVIIDTGSEKYRLNASSDFTKNAMIIVRYKKLD
jgi:hypothetical protein